MFARVGIVEDRRVDEEDHRHLHLLARRAAVCSVKQKHWILVKYCPAWAGVTLNVAVPVTGMVGEVAGA